MFLTSQVREAHNDLIQDYGIQPNLAAGPHLGWAILAEHYSQTTRGAGMFRWASVTCSSIALVAFAVVGFTTGERVRENCTDAIHFPLPPQCNVFYNISSWVFLFGLTLTVSLLFLHYLVAAQKRSWGWIITLFVVPPICVFFSAYGVETGERADLLPSLIYLPIGLPNLLFGIFGFKPRRGAARVSPPEDVPPS
jgi:hypothetical protein